MLLHGGWGKAPDWQSERSSLALLFALIVRYRSRPRRIPATVPRIAALPAAPPRAAHKTPDPADSVTLWRVSALGKPRQEPSGRNRKSPCAEIQGIPAQGLFR